MIFEFESSSDGEGNARILFIIFWANLSGSIPFAYPQGEVQTWPSADRLSRGQKLERGGGSNVITGLQECIGPSQEIAQYAQPPVEP